MKKITMLVPDDAKLDLHTLSECRTADNHGPMIDYIVGHTDVKGLVRAMENAIAKLSLRH